MIFNKNKKATIGDALTWILAFVLIAFILIVFDIIAVSISNGKGKIVNEELQNDKFISISVLNSVLQTEVVFDGEKYTISDLLSKWYLMREGKSSSNEIKEKIEQEVSFILNKLYDEDKYVFYAYYSYSKYTGNPGPLAFSGGELNTNKYITITESLKAGTYGKYSNSEYQDLDGLSVGQVKVKFYLYLR